MRFILQYYVEYYNIYFWEKTLTMKRESQNKMWGKKMSQC